MVFGALRRFLGGSGTPADLREAEPLTVLIHHQHSYAVNRIFMGLRTALPVEDLRLAAAYVLHIWDELPALESQVVEPLETEMVELLCRFYGGTPFIGYQPPALNAEIELWRLWHGQEAVAVASCPQTLLRVARPGMRRAALDLLLSRVRSHLLLTKGDVEGGRTITPEAQRDFLFLLGLLGGEVPLNAAGEYLPSADSPAPDLIRVAPVDENPDPEAR